MSLLVETSVSDLSVCYGITVDGHLVEAELSEVDGVGLGRKVWMLLLLLLGVASVELGMGRWMLLLLGQGLLVLGML